MSVKSVGRVGPQILSSAQVTSTSIIYQLWYSKHCFSKEVFTAYLQFLAFFGKRYYKFPQIPCFQQPGIHVFIHTIYVVQRSHISCILHLFVPSRAATCKKLQFHNIQHLPAPLQLIVSSKSMMAARKTKSCLLTTVRGPMCQIRAEKILKLLHCFRFSDFRLEKQRGFPARYF